MISLKKILYHGSESIIERPEYNKGAKTNDYGRGFYCTEDIELAKEWACKKQQNGYVNRYEIDLSELNVLNLNSPEYSRARKKSADIHELFMLDIMREGIKNGDTRLS